MGRFILILTDQEDGVEFGGLTEPSEFDPSSNAHKLGSFINRHAGEIIHACVSEKDSEAVSKPVLIQPERERTIYLPGDGNGS
jgi:hypothetical protein